MLKFVAACSLKHLKFVKDIAKRRTTNNLFKKINQKITFHNKDYSVVIESQIVFQQNRTISLQPLQTLYYICFPK